MKYFFLFSFQLALFFSSTNAQTIDDAELVTLETKSNDYFTGKLIRITTDSIFIQVKSGVYKNFGKINVRSIYNGEFPSNFTGTTNSSVPYYVQTALPNGAGNHYYKNYYIFGNEMNFGLSDQINLSFGVETASLIFDPGNSLPILQLGTKYSFSAQENIHLGISSKFYFNNEGSVLILDFPFTLGGNRTNITVSPNISFYDGNRPVGIFANLSLGLSEKSRFVVDYAYIDNEGIAALLYEYLFKSGFSLSIGTMIAGSEAIPNLSFSIPFGRWKRN